MKHSTKNMVKGKLYESKGTAKEAAGSISFSQYLEGKGKGEKLGGKVQ